MSKWKLVFYRTLLGKKSKKCEACKINGDPAPPGPPPTSIAMPSNVASASDSNFFPFEHLLTQILGFSRTMVSWFKFKKLWEGVGRIAVRIGRYGMHFSQKNWMGCLFWTGKYFK